MIPERDFGMIQIKISIIDRQGHTDYPLKSKSEVAQDIINRLVEELQ